MKTLGKKIRLDIKEEKIAMIQSDAISERAQIIDVGPDVPDTFKVGDTLYFKAWACDIITADDEKYYFISSDSDAICALQ